MPKKLHEQLKREAKKKGLTGDKYDAYVFGTMNKIEKEREKAKKKRK